MCVHCAGYIVAHNSAQNRPDNFPSYPPDNHHHCSDDVYLRKEGNVYGGRAFTRAVLNIMVQRNVFLKIILKLNLLRDRKI